MQLWKEMGSALFQECQLSQVGVNAIWNEPNLAWVISFWVYDPETGKNVAVTRVTVAELPETQEELAELFISELRKQIA